MGVVRASEQAARKVTVPRAWKRSRIKPTHFIFNGLIERGGKGSGKGVAEIPQFGSGWRCVHLEKEGHKWAHLLECGTGTRAKVDVSLWASMVKGGRVLAEAV